MKHLVYLFSIIISNQLFSQDAESIYKLISPSTVTIETNLKLGSGFFIEKNIIVTNFHVIQGAKFANFYISNSNKEYNIDGILAIDEENDLALLSVSVKNAPSIKMANGTISPGQKIYVIGSPKGLPATISDGIISGLRNFNGYKLIQITAPISPGSSGGPVLNSKGELIGVAVLQFKEGQNLNFAIPKNNVELLLNFRNNDVKSFAESTKKEEESSANVEISKKELYTLGLDAFKKGEFKLADSLFRKYRNKYPDEVYGYYWCFRSKSAIDLNMSQGYAITDCLSFINIAEKNIPQNLNSLITAYGYMSAYSANIKFDYNTAISWLDKILKFDPYNNDALMNREILIKESKKKKK